MSVLITLFSCSMNYSKDLLKKKQKSKLAVVLSIIFCIVAVSWIPVRFYENEEITTFDWFYTLIMLLNGVNLILTGMGYPLDRLLGKAFVNIDSTSIQIKTGAFDKEQKVFWEEIDSMHYRPGVFLVAKEDSSECKLKLKNLEYSTVQEIKNVISEIARTKNIPVNFNG